MSLNAAFTCGASNPCARDDSGLLTGSACCISADTGGGDCGRGAGNPIGLFTSAICTPSTPP
jgi:hypothetical protein